MEKKLRRYVSALSGLNEQISDKIHMHVRGNAILPEKMVSIDADMTSLNLLWPKNDKNCKFSILHGKICIWASYKSWEYGGCKSYIAWHYFSFSVTIYVYSSNGGCLSFDTQKHERAQTHSSLKQRLHILLIRKERI